MMLLKSIWVTTKVYTSLDLVEEDQGWGIAKRYPEKFAAIVPFPGELPARMVVIKSMKFRCGSFTILAIQL